MILNLEQIFSRKARQKARIARREALEANASAQDGLALIARAADTAARLDWFSPKLEVRIRAERVGTRGFWETIEVEHAQFQRNEDSNIAFEVKVIHELYESIDSSMPRQRGVRASFDVFVIFKSDGAVLSTRLGQLRTVNQMMPANDMVYQASASIDWSKVAVAAAKRVLI